MDYYCGGVEKLHNLKNILTENQKLFYLTVLLFFFEVGAITLILWLISTMELKLISDKICPDFATFFTICLVGSCK